MAFDKNNAKTHKRRKVCQFCVDKATFVDYKDVAKLKKFTSERGKILWIAPHRFFCRPRRA